MSMSELMTIVVHFHQKCYRDFKTYYTEYVMTHLTGEFPILWTPLRGVISLNLIGHLQFSR